MSNSTNNIEIPRLAPRLFGQPLAYSRAQALKDGALVDVACWADMSARSGFMRAFGCPVALTAAVCGDIFSVPAAAVCDTHVAERERAQDVMCAASYALKRAYLRGESTATFQVILPTIHSGKYQDYQITATPGDPGEGEWLIISVGVTQETP